MAFCDSYIFNKLDLTKFFHLEHSMDNVEKQEILTHGKKFRQIIYLVISLVKLLLSRNFCNKSLRENFCHFHTVVKDHDF